LHVVALVGWSLLSIIRDRLSHGPSRSAILVRPHPGPRTVTFTAIGSSALN
jgi:hypothetical protein